MRPHAAIAILAAAALAGVQAQELHPAPLVANPVGYFTTFVPANTSVPVSSPLVCGEILGDQLTEGDRVRLWDAMAQEYVIVTRTASGWSEKIALLPGDAVWLENRQVAGQTTIFAGYLPLGSPAVLDICSGLNLFGLPYFNPLSLNATPFAGDGAVAGDLQSADQVVDSESSRYWWLTAQGLWKGIELDACDTLQPFHAYWYRHRGPKGFSASFTRPYALPVAPDRILPDIPALQCSSMAAISLKVPAGSTWDIYAMELGATGTLDIVRGWHPVAESVPEKDGLLQWQDPSPISGARLFMPARSDVDSDSDGLPDTREIFRHFTDPAKKDSDGDGLPDGWEITRNLDPLRNNASENAGQNGGGNVQDRKRAAAPNESKKAGKTFFVDEKIGNDNWRGIKAAANMDEGPLKTIRAGISKAADGDTVVIAAGHYSEERQIWKTGNKRVILKPLGAVTIK